MVSILGFDPTVYVSLAFLFGIGAQFMTMDGPSFLRRILSTIGSKVGILYATVIITSIFSPLILNDLVVLILTPVLVTYAKTSRVEIAPLVVAEITFTNIASSLTPLGNPQNILLWESSGISFLSFIGGTWMPLALSGSAGAAALLLTVVLRKRAKSNISTEYDSTVAPFPIYPAIYLCVVAAILISADQFALPSYAALGFAFALGFIFTFRSVARIGNFFDLRSLAILYLLIATVSFAAVFIEPSIGQYVSPAANGTQPYSALFVAATSNIISNVPATQLILKVASVPPIVAPTIAVEAGLAGNLGPIASFANILALLIVKRAGLPIGKTIALQVLIGTVAFLPALLIYWLR